MNEWYDPEQIAEDMGDGGVCPRCGEYATTLIQAYRQGEMCHDCAIKEGDNQKKSKCPRCGKGVSSAVQVVVRDLETGEEKRTSMCPECGMREMGHPAFAKEVDCRLCHRPIDEVPCAVTSGGATQYYHEACTWELFKKNGCPKCGSKKFMSDGSCYEGHWSFKRFVEKAQADAMAIASNVDGETCSMCLAFNSATAVGLPLYPSDPWPAEERCSKCGAAVCEKHYAYPPKSNVLGLDINKPICNGAWTGSCYGELQKQLGCSVRDCEYNESSHSHSNKEYDALEGAIKCEKCGQWVCGEIHDQCPDCVGLSCDGCDRLVPQDELYSLPSDYYGHEQFCLDCISDRLCGGCGEEFSDEDRANYGYCESCAVKEGYALQCGGPGFSHKGFCTTVLDPDEAKRVYAYDGEDGIEYSTRPYAGSTEDDMVALCDDCYDEYVEPEPDPEPEDPGQTKFGFAEQDLRVLLAKVV